MSTNWVPLKHLALLNPETLDESTDPGKPFQYIDIAATGRGQLVGEPQAMTFETAPSRARRVLRTGDTILSTVRTYLRAVWTLRDARDDLVASTGFVCLRPRPCTDPRYLGWVAQSDVVVDEVVARSVGVSYPAISPSDVGLLKVPLPALEEQRAIADYLDRETARIDALVFRRRRIAELLQARLTHLVSTALFEHGSHELVRLKFVCGLPTSGNRDHGSFTYSEDGIPCLRGIDLSRDVLDREPILRISPTDHLRHLNTQLRSGDLVIVRSGATAGRCALVPVELDMCNCVDLVIVRRSPRLDPRYLAYVVRSREVQDAVLHGASGALQPHFNAVDAGELSIPMRPLLDQHRIADMLDSASRRTRETIDVFGRQVTLLIERRSALISAAVSGATMVPLAA